MQDFRYHKLTVALHSVQCIACTGLGESGWGLIIYTRQCLRGRRRQGERTLSWDEDEFLKELGTYHERRRTSLPLFLPVSQSANEWRRGIFSSFSAYSKTTPPLLTTLDHLQRLTLNSWEYATKTTGK